MNMRSLADHSFYNTSETLRLIRVLHLYTPASTNLLKMCLLTNQLVYN